MPREPPLTSTGWDQLEVVSWRIHHPRIGRGGCERVYPSNAGLPKHPPRGTQKLTMISFSLDRLHDRDPLLTGKPAAAKMKPSPRFLGAGGSRARFSRRRGFRPGLCGDRRGGGRDHGRVPAWSRRRRPTRPKCGACERFCGRKRRKNAQNGPNRLTANSDTTTNTCPKLHEELADYFKRLI
jgi:hypothetical protein